jgi:hypothetical protein
MSFCYNNQIWEFLFWDMTRPWPFSMGGETLTPQRCIPNMKTKQSLQNCVASGNQTVSGGGDGGGVWDQNQSIPDFVRGYNYNIIQLIILWFNVDIPSIIHVHDVAKLHFLLYFIGSRTNLHWTKLNRTNLHWTKLRRTKVSSPSPRLNIAS